MCAKITLRVDDDRMRAYDKDGEEEKKVEGILEKICLCKRKSDRSKNSLEKFVSISVAKKKRKRLEDSFRYALCTTYVHLIHHIHVA